MDITDALDSYLISKVRVEEWNVEFFGMFYRPIAEMMIGQALIGARDERFFDQNKLNANLSPGAQKVLRGE